MDINSKLNFYAVKDILMANKDKPFVKRILNPERHLDLGEGDYGTHLMTYAEADGKYYVYPTIVDTPMGLIRMNPDEAFDYNLGSGNYIKFDNEDQADWFSKNYKEWWK